MLKELTKPPHPETNPDEVRAIPFNKIRPSPTNPRKTFDEAALEELAASIRKVGILEPILVRRWHGNGGYEIVAGERRWRSAKLAGLQVVPSIVRSLTDNQVREIQLIENVQREDLDPIEQGQGYKDLIDNHNYTAESLAEKLGMSKAHVYAMVKLAQAPPTARQLFAEGKISRTHVELVSRLPNAELREECAKVNLKPQYAGDEFPSVRMFKECIEKQYMRELKGAPFPANDAELVPAAGACRTCPKRTGNDRQTFPDGRADVCTDISCFEAKREAWKKHELDRIKEKGIKILSPAERSQVFTWRGSTDVAANADYYDLKDQARTKDGKRPSYKQLLGEEMADQVVAAADDHGNIHYLVPKKAAEPVLKQKGVRGISDWRDTPSERRWQKVQAARMKKEREQARIRTAGYKLAIDKAVTIAVTRHMGLAGGSSPVMTAMLRSLAAGVVAECWHEDVKKVIARRGIERKPHNGYCDDRRILVKHIETVDAPGAIGVMTELVAWKAAESSQFAADAEKERIRDFWKSLGVDVAKCMREGKKGTANKKPKRKAVKK